jgi:hypothetical protein
MSLRQAVVAPRLTTTKKNFDLSKRPGLGRCDRMCADLRLQATHSINASSIFVTQQMQLEMSMPAKELP